MSKSKRITALLVALVMTLAVTVPVAANQNGQGNNQGNRPGNGQGECYCDDSYIPIIPLPANPFDPVEW